MPVTSDESSANEKLREILFMKDHHQKFILKHNMNYTVTVFLSIPFKWPGKYRQMDRLNLKIVPNLKVIVENIIFHFENIKRYIANYNTSFFMQVLIYTLAIHLQLLHGSCCTYYLTTFQRRLQQYYYSHLI